MARRDARPASAAAVGDGARSRRGHREAHADTRAPLRAGDRRRAAGRNARDLRARAPGGRVARGARGGHPLDDACVDGVFCGQAAHWFANGDAIAEISRVLRPGGILVAAWNEPDPDRPSPLPDDYRRRLADVRPPLPQEDGWAYAVASGPFEAARDVFVEHEQVSDREGILRSTSSMSWIASRNDREAIVAELGTLLPKGDYRLPLRTSVIWTVRR